MVNQNNCLQSLHSALKSQASMAYQKNLTFDPTAWKHIPVYPLTSPSPLLAHKGTESSLDLSLLMVSDVTQFLTHPPGPMPLSSLLPRTNVVARKMRPLEKLNACVSSARKAVGVFIIIIIIFLWAEQVTGHNNIIYSNLLLQIRTF